jgi:pSer/pThr/pTyr-binding forkhead associated (FHA) protein
MVTSRTIEPGKAILVVQEGWETSLRFEIVNPVSRCGRSPNSDLLLDDVTVSRKHAEIIRDDSEFWLVDQGSINGTYLNGRRVLRGRLNSGDKLQIGKFRLVFMVGTD